ncbi:ACP S-malonyltransferase [Buchnera aphidicola (Chaitoregma tattakana)]|uniref:ACP S-malonyltransferase n=1 Tax=Buchnera aphidicola TaxID=9 RepID=UPI0031B7EF92
MNFAIIFPGQYKYSIRKIVNLYKHNNIIKNIFEKASDIIKYDIYHNICNIPIEKIKNRYLQPIIVTISIAIYKMWKKNVIYTPKIIAGHSLGEYTALICANSINLEEGLLITKKRGELMEKSSNKRKISTEIIFGLTEQEISKICKCCSTKSIVEIASITSQNIIIISGDESAVNMAIKLCKQKGSTKNISLPISVPIHCKIIKSVRKEYLKMLSEINFLTPKYNIVNNIDAKVIYTKQNIIKYLYKQLYKTVRWKECIDYIIKKNVKLFLEMSTNKIFINTCKNFAQTITINNMKNILYSKKKIKTLKKK